MSSRPALVVVAVLCMMVVGCGGRSPSGAPAPSVEGNASEPAASPASARPSVAAEPTPPTCSTEPVPSPGGSEDWWRDRVFYEVFVRSFADSDADGIGDLQGLISRLDALNDGDPSTTHDLGVGALWLMPVAESPSYHGYDVIDYTAVESDYGTNDDFRALIDAAHERGIKVIVDLVLNHTSVEHPWFQDARMPGSEHDDWYVWADAHPGFGGPGGRSVWHADGDRWYYGYFWEGMPDLDLADRAVTAELDSISRFWLTEMGVDGFRLDAARHLLEDGSTLENTPATFDWLQGFRSRMKHDKVTALVLGEVWDSSLVSSRYVEEGALDLTFDFGLASQWLLAVRSGDAASLRHVQAEITEVYPAGGYATFLSNHDQDRVFDVVGREPARAKQAATLLLTSAGVPFVYYGEEIGLRGRKPDERIRTPMPWTGEAPGFGFTTADAPWQRFAEGVAQGTNVAAQAADPDSLLSHYRELIRLRTAHPALRGNAPIVDVSASDPGVYGTLRHQPGGETVVVVSNLSDDPVADVVLSLPTGPLCGHPRAQIVFGTPAASVLAPTVTPTGGFDAWSVGDLEPHEDLIVRLAP